MKNNLIRKCLVCGILLLFFGLSISTNIGGTVNNHTPESIPMNHPIANDFILGNWKMDECSGNTAEDSSGHSFDGQINGATWISYGTGCALEFDGTNDFVGLDSYSEHLGMNKTDDLIFSVHFNSSSSTDGMIFSMTDNWNKQNPELSLKLCANGSVMFKVWTLYCGISIFSDEDYNNGKWHSARIIYRGSTANPTIEMWVDGSLDTTKTDWLCPINADEFKKAKIGRRAYDATIHFDGGIDRLKIVKYPDGNDKPSEPEIDGPQFGLVGQELNYTFVSEDLEEDELDYMIDWGDGHIENWDGPHEPGVEIIRSHIYAKNGTYNITARARDFWHKGHWTDPSYRVSIGNHAPWTPDQPIGPIKGSIDIEYTYKATTTDVEENPIWYQWDWGDGNFSDWIGPYPSGDTCEASYTWDKPGEYYIRVRAKDELGMSGWSFPLSVNIVISALEIAQVSGNILLINAVIQNKGEWRAKDITWSIDLIGGIILSGINSSGTISSIEEGEEATIKSDIIFGFGAPKIRITVTADDGSFDQEERSGFVFLFFLSIRSGGQL